MIRIWRVEFKGGLVYNLGAKNVKIVIKKALEQTKNRHKEELKKLELDPSDISAEPYKYDKTVEDIIEIKLLAEGED